MKVMFLAVSLMISGQVWAQDNSHPCRQYDASRSLDMLIGDWDVYSNGKVGARYSYRYAHAKCVIFVTETSRNGKTRSGDFFYYDRKTLGWRVMFSTPHFSDMYVANYSEKSFSVIAVNLDKNGERMRQQVAPYLRETFSVLADGSLRRVTEAADNISGPWKAGRERLMRKVGN